MNTRDTNRKSLMHNLPFMPAVNTIFPSLTAFGWKSELLLGYPISVLRPKVGVKRSLGST